MAGFLPYSESRGCLDEPIRHCYDTKHGQRYEYIASPMPCASCVALRCRDLVAFASFIGLGVMPLSAVLSQKIRTVGKSNSTLRHRYHPADNFMRQRCSVVN